MRRLAAIVLLCLLAGCATPRAPATDTPAEGTSTAPAVALTAALEPVPAARPAPAPLENLTQFHWALPGAFPEGRALQLDLALGKGNDCTLAMGASSAATGPSALVLFEGRGWGAGASGHLAAAHAGPVDTRGDSGGASGFATEARKLSGDQRVTIVAQDLQPGSRLLKGDASLAVSITCDAPFAVRDAQAGAQAMLVNDANLSGGAGAEAFIVGSATVQGAASLDFTAPKTRMAGGGFGAHGARVTVQHPAGSTEWDWLPDLLVPVTPDTFTLDDGAGTIGFTVDRAGAFYEAFWLAAWGLDGPIDLRANQVPESALDL